MANMCGCTPKACPTGANCGSVDNGCGAMVNCGAACTAPQTCGGGGTANVCGCKPTTCAAQNAECGTIDDGCGGMLTCPTCNVDQSCVANHCVVIGADDLGTTGGVPDLSTGHTGGGGCSCYVAARSGTAEPWGFFAVALTLGLALLRRRAFTAPR
jgi:hypothetical protein